MSRSATQPTAAANPTKGSVRKASPEKRAQRTEPEPQPERVAKNKRASVADAKNSVTSVSQARTSLAPQRAIAQYAILELLD